MLSTRARRAECRDAQQVFCLAKSTIVVAVALVLLLARGRAASDPNPSRDELQIRVDGAIDRGTAWLEGYLAQQGLAADALHGSSSEPISGDRFGAVVLASLAYVHGCDARPSKLAPACLDFVRRRWQSSRSTYSSGLALMLLCAMHEQSSRGQLLAWDKSMIAQRRLTGNDLHFGQSVADWVQSCARDLWGYGLGSRPDMSNSQYAALGLLAAGRMGLKVADMNLSSVEEEALRWQWGDGDSIDLRIEPESEGGYARSTRQRSGRAVARGFPYNTPESTVTEGSTTASGVAVLLSLRELAQGRRGLDAVRQERVDAGIRDGIAWIAKNFTVDRNPSGSRSHGDHPSSAVPITVVSPSERWHYYYLYGLERVGDLTGIKKLQEHDWYREGAELLLHQQRADGSWFQPYQGPKINWGAAQLPDWDCVTDTAFAVLFLKRATRSLLPPAAPATPITPSR